MRPVSEEQIEIHNFRTSALYTIKFEWRMDNLMNLPPKPISSKERNRNLETSYLILKDGPYLGQSIDLTRSSVSYPFSPATPPTPLHHLHPKFFYSLELASIVRLSKVKVAKLFPPPCLVENTCRHLSCHLNTVYRWSVFICGI